MTPDTMTVERGKLGGRLQMARGWRWAFGVNGDPYAMLLCGHDDDPWRWYERIREADPRWSRSRTGTWVTTSHAEAARVLGDPAFTRVTEPAWAGAFADARPAGKPRSPGRDQVDQAYSEVLARLTGPVDLMRDLAREGSLRAVASWLGLSDEDRTRLGKYLPADGVSLDAPLSPQRLGVTEDAIAASAGIEELTGDPDLAALIGTGTEMAATAVCHAVLATTRTPGLADRLAGNPDLVTEIVAETLRATPPVHLERRRSTEDRELSGVEIEAGSEVVVAVAAANRDPEIFTDPGRFDPDRADAGRTLTVGGQDGLDEFVTAHVEAALRALAPRLPRLSRPGPVIYRRRSPVLRGISRCPVDL